MQATSFDDELLGLRAEVLRLRKESHEAQRELAELRDSLAARDAFIATAGHELRNAVGGIVIAATNLQFLAGRTEGLPPWVASRLEAMVRQSRGFARRATTLLDVSRLTCGGLRLDRVPLCLAEIARAAIEELGPEAERARCAITVVADGRVNGHWDRDALEQVAVNLISNAIKYGAGKPIEVTVASARGDATLSVRDHGVGIGEADRLRIFGRFERAVRREDLPGFGMGLWIARQLVQAHHGEIKVESQPGCGSVFTVRLPGVNLVHRNELPRIPSKT